MEFTFAKDLGGHTPNSNFLSINLMNKFEAKFD